MQPESEQPTVPRCEMKFEEMEGSSEILQIKIEDVNSFGLEEEENDQLNGELCDPHPVSIQGIFFLLPNLIFFFYFVYT